VRLSFAEWANENSTTPTATQDSETGAASPSASTGSEVNSIESMLQNEKFDQARSAIGAFAQEHPDSDVVQRLNGELHERTGDNDSALKELGAYLEKKPDDALGQFYYALALYVARDFPDALQHEQKSDAMAPTAADQPVLALLYYSMRDYSNAEKAAATALTSDPKSTLALEVLAGIAYHGASDGKTTWQEYATSLATLDPDNFWVHFSRALDAYNRQQVETAVAEFKAAEKTSFPDTTPFYLLSNWFASASQLGAADDQIAAGLASVPDDPQLLSEGIFVSLRAHEDTEAGRRFDSLAQDYPDALITQAAGCLYYYGIGQPQQALAYCARQVTLSPTDHTAYSNYGWAALDANQFDLAQQEFSQAYKIAYPNWNQMDKTQLVDLLWGFTLAEYNSGDKKYAHKLLRVLRTTYPDAATVTGLQQLPLLWSDTTMNRIETILMEWPK
jgi:tetratricopeptide (TPR) repeat protein